MTALLAALLLQAVQPAPATLPPLPPLHGGPVDTVCPVGGEHFAAWQATMYSTYGERPDGKPYSYLPFPFPLPTCPSNGLVMFDRFGTDDVAALTELIATPAYRRLLATDTGYYRGYWLATRLKRPATETLGLLLPAIWQVTGGDVAASGDAARAKRYQEILVAGARALPPTTAPGDRLWLTARAANAARQLGRFGEAETLRRQALALLPQVADRGGWPTYLDKLAPAIARHDASLEPLDLIPDREAAAICVRHAPADPFGTAWCARPDVAAQAALIRGSTRR